MKKEKAGISMKDLLKLLKNEWPTVILSSLFSLISVLFSLRLPVKVGGAIDLLIGKDNVNLQGVGKLLLQSAVFALISALFQWFSSLLSNKTAYSISRRIRDDAFCHIQSLPLSYLDKAKTGDLVNRITTDADSFSDGMLLGTSQFISGTVTIVGTLISMLTLSVPVAILVFLLTPLSFLVARFIAKNTHDMFVAQTKARGEQSAFLDETISGQKVIKGLLQEENRRQEFSTLDRKFTDASKKATFFSSLTNPSTRFVNAIIYAAVAFFGARLCISGLLTVGGLSAMLSYASSYGKPFNEISSVLAEMQNALVCAGRLLEIINLEPQKDEKDKDSLRNVEGSVNVNDLRFSYTKDKKLIEDLSFEAKPGQKIAIVGPTGCGKTTLINLLMRFYEPDGGTISVDGIPTGTVKRESVRENFGMVLQDTWLRTGTIKENISLGYPEATDEEIEAAAKAAMADSFIRRLPYGYNTVVSDEEGILSAGQKQLLCLARVMLRTPQMLILDEATSSIDTRTELMVQEAFDKLMQGRTTFIVAHRLSTIRSADLILVMKDGNIVEQGTHEELLSKGGFYAELYKKQFETL